MAYTPQYGPGTSKVAANRRKQMNPNYKLEKIRDVTDEGKRRFGKTASYGKMVEPHHKIHEYANANIAYIHDGIPDSHLEHGEEIVRKFKAMEAASDELFDLMDRMLVEVHGVYQ